MKEIKGLYTITALSWKPDATKLYAVSSILFPFNLVSICEAGFFENKFNYFSFVVKGSLTGAVEIFDCCLKKVVYKNKYEISYVGSNQVCMKWLIFWNFI